MKYKETPSPYSIEVIFLNFLGIGLFPWAPGTLASLAALPILYALAKFAVPIPLLVPILLLSIVGSGLVAQMVQERHGVHDPKWIVIDEVIGMFVGFIFYPSSQWWSLLLLFVLFRFFDIFKIWPASFFDQKIKHGIGVILDDVVAGIYAGVINFLVHIVFFK